MGSAKKQPSVTGLWGVRYQVKDVQRSISFYTKTLGFHLDRQNLPAFGRLTAVSRSPGDGTASCFG